MSSQQWASREYFCTGCDRDRLQDELQQQRDRNVKLEQTTRELSERLSAIERERNSAARHNRSEQRDDTAPRQETHRHQGDQQRESDHGYANTRRDQPRPGRRMDIPRVQKGLLTCYGDSMVKYPDVRQALNAFLPHNMVAETDGKSGDKIADIRPRAAKALKAMERKPEYNIIHGGINDYMKGATEDKILDEVERTIKAVNKVAEETKCLWAGIIPVERKSWNYNRHIMELNERIQRRCHRHGWGYVDPSAFMEMLYTTTRKEMEEKKIYYDGLHLDVGGAEVYAKAVAAAVRAQGN